MTTTTIDIEATAALAEAYSKAWNDHDLDAILAMHAPVSAFHLHVAPYPEADGHAAMRQQFAAFFAIMPDIAFTTLRQEVRAGLYTQEWEVTATIAEPWLIGNRTAAPTGEPIRFRGVDIISCEEGKVRRKDCYLDGVGLELALFGS